MIISNTFNDVPLFIYWIVYEIICALSFTPNCSIFLDSIGLRDMKLCDNSTQFSSFVIKNELSKVI